MFKNVSKLFVLAIVPFITLSCMTTKMVGPGDFVSYKTDDKLKSSTQVSGLIPGKESLLSTYDHENTYDEKGNLIKVKLTEYINYFDADKKFIIWETWYKIIGGNIVPWKVSANGVAFITIEYDILTVANKGPVTEDISERPFSLYITALMLDPFYIDLNVSLSNYSVGFKVDNQFVKDVLRFNSSQGLYTERVLTLGYDNIVLKHFQISEEALAEGIAKSYTGYNANSEMYRKMSKGNNVNFNYEWKVIANKICETKMIFEAKKIKLEVNEDYNAAGQRIKEVWFASDPSNTKEKPTLIFQQDLKY